MKIAIGCDHGALELKEALIPFLLNLGHSVQDFGTCTAESCDYPDHAIAAARAVSKGECDRGIVLCTTGIGVSIAANKVRGVRCALLSDVNSAIMTRLHNDSNMMAMGSAVVDRNLAYEIVEAWLATPFSNEERHKRRIDKVMANERGLKKERSRKPKRRKSIIGRFLSALLITPISFIFNFLSGLFGGVVTSLIIKPLSFLIIKPLSILLSILLVFSLVLTPVATYVTSMSDPSRVVEILFSSGLFDSAEEPSEEAPSEEVPSGEATPPSDSDTPVNGENTDTPAGGENTDAPVGGENTDAPAGGEDANTPAPAAEENADAPADGENTDAPADGENTDTPADGENTDTPAGGETTNPPTENPQSPDSSLSAAQGLLGALQNLVSSGIVDEDVLHSTLGIPEDTPIDTDRLCEELAKSEAASALVSAYVTDAMNAAMDPNAAPTLTSDTVMDIIAPHVSELADIVETCLPEGTEVDRAALEAATLEAAQAALPALVDSLPDATEAVAALKEQAPIFDLALNMLRFIRSGGLRAIVILLAVALIIILCFFRLPGLRGLLCVGICGTISAIICGALYLLLNMPTLHSLLAMLPLIGSIISEFSAGFAHEFAVCGVVYGVIGLALILGTTVFRVFFSSLFDAIFGRD